MGTMNTPNSAVRILSTTYLFGGSEVSFDAEAQCGFVCVEHDADGCVWASARTVELSDSLNIDLDADGRVRGIETVGHEVNLSDLLAVIHWMNERRAEQTGGEVDD